MNSNRKVIASLADALKGHLAEWYGDGARLRTDSAALHSYPNSFFVSYPVETSRGAQTLLAKIHRKPGMRTLNDALAATWLRPIARDEYEMTQLIWRAFEEENSPVCATVQPLGFVEEWNAIIIRKVDGVPLKDHLLRASVLLRRSAALAELRQYLESSVTWLRVFHNRVGKANEVPFPISDAVEWMNDILSRLEKHSNGQVDAAPYRAILSNQLARIGRLHVPVALLHDDFQYSNILITADNRACVLDYELNHRGCVYSDLATLLVDPQTRAAQIMSDGRFVPPSFIRALNETIQTAYFDGGPFYKSVLDFFCALAILNKWSADEADMNTGWRRRLHPLLSRSIRHYYERLLSHYL